MLKGKSRTKALQLYKDWQQVDAQRPHYEDDVIDYVPACDVRVSEPARQLSNSVTASQIIHTQNVHHHHYPKQKPEIHEPKTEKVSSEEALLWFAAILGVAFTFGFLIATLLRG